MFHAKPEASLSVSDVARALYVQPQTADDLMEALCLAGLLTVREPPATFTATRRSTRIWQDLSIDWHRPTPMT